MKLGFLLLLPLLIGAQASAPPAVRVTFSPLTKAAYLQAKNPAWIKHEKRTFSLTKSKGKIVIPTAGGDKVFKDKIIGHEEENTTYEYLGYSPHIGAHLIRMNHWEGEEILVHGVLVVKANGSIMKFISEPVYSPDRRHTAVFFHTVFFLDEVENVLQIFSQQENGAKLLWETHPETWEPVEVVWVSNNTVFVKKKQYKNGEPYKPAHFTYSKIVIN